MTVTKPKGGRKQIIRSKRKDKTLQNAIAALNNMSDESKEYLAKLMK